MESTAILYQACAGRNLYEIEKALENEPSVDTRDEDGLSALHLALQTASDEARSIAERLLSHGADVNAATPGGDTALHLVSAWSDELLAEEVALCLLHYGADVDWRNTKLRRAYDIAVNNDLTNLAELVSGECSLEDAIDTSKRRRRDIYSDYLIEAVIAGDLALITKSIAENAYPDMINKHGNAALHYVITHCPLVKTDIAALLTDAGADINLANHGSDTALHLTIKSAALRSDDSMYQLTRYLLKKGASCNICDLDGADAVSLSRSREYDDITALLLEGAALQREDSVCICNDVPEECCSHEDIAVDSNEAKTNKEGECSDDEAEDIDVKSETSVSQHGDAGEEDPRPADHGRLQLHEVVRERTLAEIRECFDAADAHSAITSPDENGNYPIHLAVLRPNDEDKQEIIKLVILKGAHLNAVETAKGRTALHIAVDRNDEAAVMLLLENGCDVSILNSDGDTAYDVALALGYNAIAMRVQPRDDVEDPDTSKRKTKLCVIV